MNRELDRMQLAIDGVKQKQQAREAVGELVSKPTHYCPQCRAMYTFIDDQVGQRVTCSSCGKVFGVSSPHPVKAVTVRPSQDVQRPVVERSRGGSLATSVRIVWLIIGLMILLPIAIVVFVILAGIFLAILSTDSGSRGSRSSTSADQYETVVIPPNLREKYNTPTKIRVRKEDAERARRNAIRFSE